MRILLFADNESEYYYYISYKAIKRYVDGVFRDYHSAIDEERAKLLAGDHFLYLDDPSYSVFDGYKNAAIQYLERLPEIKKLELLI